MYILYIYIYTYIFIFIRKLGDRGRNANKEDYISKNTEINFPRLKKDNLKLKDPEVLVENIM